MLLEKWLSINRIPSYFPYLERRYMFTTSFLKKKTLSIDQLPQTIKIMYWYSVPVFLSLIWGLQRKHIFHMFSQGIRICMHTKSLLLCPALCDPMDCSPPGSSVHGNLQARILVWISMPSSRGSYWPRDPNFVCLLYGQAGSLPLVTPVKPWIRIYMYINKSGFLII